MNVLDICVTLVEIKLTRCLFVLWSLVLLIYISIQYFLPLCWIQMCSLISIYPSYLQVVLRRPLPRNGFWKCVYSKVEVVCVYFSSEPVKTICWLGLSFVGSAKEKHKNALSLKALYKSIVGLTAEHLSRYSFVHRNTDVLRFRIVVSKKTAYRCVHQKFWIEHAGKGTLSILGKILMG